MFIFLSLVSCGKFEVHLTPSTPLTGSVVRFVFFFFVTRICISAFCRPSTANTGTLTTPMWLLLQLPLTT